MSVIRCPQGHYYDGERFSSCPHCGISFHQEEKKQEPSKGGLFGWLDREKTVSLKAVEQTLPEDDQKTIGHYSGARGNDYVAGWLVCVDGPEKGRDYRLHHGFNRIGRDFGMDVQVMDDPTITRKNHCSVVFDERSSVFSLVPSTGAITYFHDQLLERAETLSTGDQFKIGNSTFEFIPFCRKGHIWERGEEVMESKEV